MESLSRDQLLARLRTMVNSPQGTLINSADSSTELLKQAMEMLHSNRPYYHWVGLYGLIGEKLYLGPYCGPPTDHVEIPVGRGVCGTAVKEQINQRIDDVRTLDNYLACNLETKSELVVLIWNQNRTQILGQIDVDGSAFSAFSPEEEAFIEAFAQILSPIFACWLEFQAKARGMEPQIIGSTKVETQHSATQKVRP
jgi:L-methionine (R)-S-oxide reductase